MKAYKYYKILLYPIKLWSCAFALLCVFSQQSYAQNNITTLQNTFTQHTSEVFTEKLYLHTDKDFYSTGEVLWLKIYYTDARTHIPQNLSRVAYVEILDEKNNPVIQEKISINNSEGYGSIYLPQAIASGNYKIRAYTNWMKNFNEDYFFEKIISIVNVRKTPTDSVRQKNNQTHTIQFFPEGGEMVDNIKSKVAFSAKDAQGLDYNFTGYLIENNVDTVLRFQPSHAGMGYFTFTPRAGKNYIAEIAPVKGTKFRNQLPQVKQEGYVLHLTEKENGELNVAVSTNIFSETSFYLIAHTRENIKYSSVLNVQDGEATFSFNKSLLGDGVSVITVFNSDRKPVAERLFFKKPSSILNIKIEPEINTYKTRTPVNIRLTTSAADMDSASLSMSVYKLDSLQKININEENITTYLLLTSELKGYIENPAYYFAQQSQAADADLLMLTQGWRKFDWNKNLSSDKESFSFVPEINGHILTGKVEDIVTGNPVPNVMVYLGTPSPIIQFRTGLSNNSGNFKSEISNLFGSNSIIAQTNEQLANHKITINSPFSNNYSTYKYPQLLNLKNYPNTLQQQDIAMQVQNIYLSEKINTFSYPFYVSDKPFYHTPDYKYLLDDYTRFTTIEEVLREYVVIVAVRRKDGKVQFPIIDTDTKGFFPFASLNMLDGVPVFDLNKFIQFDPHKIKSLEIISKRYAYGKSIFDGILNWQTYKPDMSNYSFDATTLVVDYKGLQMQRTFYEPDYNHQVNVLSKMPDFRNVLKWKPDIKLKKDEQKNIQLFSSDITGKFVVVVEGLSNNGISGSAAATFDVQ